MVVRLQIERLASVGVGGHLANLTGGDLVHGRVCHRVADLSRCQNDAGHTNRPYDTVRVERLGGNVGCGGDAAGGFSWVATPSPQTPSTQLVDKRDRGGGSAFDEGACVQCMSDCWTLLLRQYTGAKAVSEASNLNCNAPAKRVRSHRAYLAELRLPRVKSAPPLSSSTSSTSGMPSGNTISWFSPHRPMCPLCTNWGTLVDCNQSHLLPCPRRPRT